MTLVMDKLPYIAIRAHNPSIRLVTLHKPAQKILIEARMLELMRHFIQTYLEVLEVAIQIW